LDKKVVKDEKNAKNSQASKRKELESRSQAANNEKELIVEELSKYQESVGQAQIRQKKIENSKSKQNSQAKNRK
jgi:hypothetical protein